MRVQCFVCPSTSQISSDSLSAQLRLAWPKRIGDLAKGEQDRVREPTVRDPGAMAVTVGWQGSGRRGDSFQGLWDGAGLVWNTKGGDTSSAGNCLQGDCGLY